MGSLAKLVKKQYWCISFQDLDKLVEAVYGHEYNTLDGLYDNFKNDMWLSFKVEPESITESEWLADPDEALEKWEEMGHSLHPLVMLNDMCHRNIIESGNYLLEICW